MRGALVKKEIKLGVFENFGLQTGAYLAWPHPRSEQLDFRSIDFWIRRARILDEAGFAFQFFADGYGYPTDTTGRVRDDAVRAGIVFPSYSPEVLVAALAHATTNLGFVVTQTTGRDHPIQAAKRFATLDHLTGGRVGWNVVTGNAQDVVQRVFGDPEIAKHDERYVRAEEYVELAVKYWEECWDDDAVVEDVDERTFARPEGLHRIEHVGSYYQSSGYLAVDPSPQRTPLLFQAGSSNMGRSFASRNAECVFVQFSTIEKMRATVTDIRRRTGDAGRDPASIKIMVNANIIPAESRERALQLRREFDELQSDELIIASFKSLTGVELSELDMNKTLFEQIEYDGRVGEIAQTNLDSFRERPGQPAPTVRQIIDHLKGVSGDGFNMTGDAAFVCDEIEQLIDQTDLDGVLVRPVFGMGTIEDFAQFVVPELRRRGRMPDRPAEGLTLRERMLGSSHRKVPTARTESLFDVAAMYSV